MSKLSFIKGAKMKSLYVKIIPTAKNPLPACNLFSQLYNPPSPLYEKPQPHWKHVWQHPWMYDLMSSTVQSKWEALVYLVIYDKSWTTTETPYWAKTVLQARTDKVHMTDLKWSKHRHGLSLTGITWWSTI